MDDTQEYKLWDRKEMLSLLSCDTVFEDIEGVTYFLDLESNLPNYYACRLYNGEKTSITLCNLFTTELRIKKEELLRPLTPEEFYKKVVSNNYNYLEKINSTEISSICCIEFNSNIHHDVHLGCGNWFSMGYIGKNYTFSDGSRIGVYA